VAGERVVVESRVIGTTEDGAAVLEHHVEAEGRPCVTVTAARRLAGERGRSALHSLA